jgi:nucleotide-binding universal stress UspA family protein
MNAPRRILVPVDFSACSKAALDYAMNIAERLGASVDVLHVWEPPHYITPETVVYIPGEPGQSLSQYARSQANRAMEELLSSARRDHGPSLSGRIEAGQAVGVILEHAKGDAFDLIVMGTHGRTGLSHLLVGSVTERVVRRAPCPVLTIRVPEAAPGETVAPGDAPDFDPK